MSFLLQLLAPFRPAAKDLLLSKGASVPAAVRSNTSSSTSTSGAGSNTSNSTSTSGAGSSTSSSSDPLPSLRPMDDHVLAVEYPARCSGKAFFDEFAVVTQELLETRRPFALLHDMRAVNLATVERSFVYLEAATKIGKEQYVRGVALVLGSSLSPWLVQTANAMLWMSPVQPVKVFKEQEEALKWCQRTLI